MNRDEWQQAMENEAESVGDVHWAKETRQAAQRWWADLPLPLCLFAALTVAQVLLFASHPPAQLWLSVMLIVGACSAVLGWRGVHPFAAGVGALAYFPAAWLTVVLWQWLAPHSAPFLPGIDDMGSVVLAVLSANAASVGQFFRHRRQGRWVKL